MVINSIHLIEYFYTATESTLKTQFVWNLIQLKLSQI